MNNISKYNNIPSWGKLLFLIDVVIVLFSTIFSFFYIYKEPIFTSDYVLVIIVYVLIVMLSLYIFRVYQHWYSPSAYREIKAILSAWFIAIVLMTLLAFIFKMGASFSRLWFGLASIISILFIGLSRFAFRFIMIKTNGQSWNSKNIIMLGKVENINYLKQTIKSQHWAGLTILPTLGLPNLHSHNINTYLESITDFLQNANDNVNNHENTIQQIWIIMEDFDHAIIQSLNKALELHSVDIVYVPSISLILNEKHDLLYIAGIPVFRPATSSLSPSKAFLKAFEDYFLTTIILIIISPVMVVISIGVKLSSPGPVFYRQSRVTLYGKKFEMLKFRSMPTDVESMSGPVWAKQGENRATKFGAFLRKTSLDELPQFINVLQGDMSIVGPRPERPEFVEEFKTQIPRYMKKHLLKAGITGWAQVHGFRGNTSLEQRINHDIYYINQWSPTLDLRIIFMTIYKGFINKSAY